MTHTTDMTVASDGTALYRTSTNAAGLCKEIVVATARNIQGRKYVQVEGWQAIAIAHGCAASSGEVTKTEEGGYSAIGTVRRMDTGSIVATAEGYVGPDEPTWFGGPSNGKILPKRPDYAIRAMAQTRAISRACRSAFAHVVVMMNAGLSTTPAEEVPPGGFDQDERPAPAPATTRTEAIKAKVLPPPTTPPGPYADAMDKATSLDELAEVADSLRGARLSPADRKALGELYKQRQAELEGAAA
jgi:hypothetical protein